MTHKCNTRGGMLGGIFGGFGGGIFGSISWLVGISAMADDWTTMTAVIVVAIILFIVCIKICWAKPSRSWAVAQWMVVAICAISLAVVNLRWDRWMANPRSQKHILASGDTLMTYNVMIPAVCAGLIVLFFILSKTCKKHLVEYELRQMQIKDL